MTEPGRGRAVGFVRAAAAEWDNDRADDAELVRRFVASRDGPAFAALVRRHGPAVWRVCRAVTRHGHDAEDAYQATFLLLARKASGLRSAGSVGGWLCGTAYRVAVRARVWADRRPQTGGPEPASPVAGDDLTVREAERILHEELARLPGKYRDPLVLCCLEGLTRDEAAKRLGWSLNTLKSRLEYGRDRLRGRLIRRGISLTVPLFASLLSPPAGAGLPPTGVIVATVAGETAPSAAVLSLVTGVSRAMTMTKLLTAATLAGGLMALTAGGLLVVHADGPGTPSADPPKPAANPKPAVAPATIPAQAIPVPKPLKDWTAEEVATEFRRRVLAGEFEKAAELCNPERMPLSDIQNLGRALKPPLLVITLSAVSRERLARQKEVALQKENELLKENAPRNENPLPKQQAGGRRGALARQEPEMMAIFDKFEEPGAQGPKREAHCLLMLTQDGKDNTWRVDRLMIGYLKDVAQYLPQKNAPALADPKPAGPAVLAKPLETWTAEEVVTELRRRVLAGEFEQAAELCNPTRLTAAKIQKLSPVFQPPLLVITPSDLARKFAEMKKEQEKQIEKPDGRQMPQPARDPRLQRQSELIESELMAIFDKVPVPDKEDYYLVLILKKDGKNNSWRVAENQIGRRNFVEKYLPPQKEEKPR